MLYTALCFLSICAALEGARLISLRCRCLSRAAIATLDAKDERGGGGGKRLMVRDGFYDHRNKSNRHSHTYAHTCICACKHVHTHTRVRSCIHTYIHSYVHALLRTYVHKCKQLYMPVCAYACLFHVMVLLTSTHTIHHYKHKHKATYRHSPTVLNEWLS